MLDEFMQQLNATGPFAALGVDGERVMAWMYSRNAMDTEQCADWCDGSQADAGMYLSDSRDLVHYGDYIVQTDEGAFLHYGPTVFDQEFTRI